VCSELAIPKLRGHYGRLCSAMASAERAGTHLAHMEVCAPSLCFFFFSHAGALRLVIMAWLGDLRDSFIFVVRILGGLSLFPLMLLLLVLVSFCWVCR
jgi:hypothetical protein